MLSFWLTHKLVSFFFSVCVLCFELLQEFFLSDKFLFWIKEFLGKVRYFDFIFRIFVFKLVTNKLTLFSNRKDIIIIVANNHLIDFFGVRLEFINFLVQVKRIATISDRARLIFFISTVHENFFTVQKHNFRYVWVSENSTRRWNCILDCILLCHFTLFIFLSLWGYFDLINTLVLIADWRIECTTHVNCSLINQAQFFILPNEITSNRLNVQSWGCQNL